MSRLPQPGGDKGTWGDVLNDFLSQAHNVDGTIKQTALDSQIDAKIATQATADAARYRRSDVINVLDYGATDPTAIGAAIVAAVTALPATGGEVIIPAGTYTLNATVVITKSNVTIRGISGARIQPTANPTGTLRSAGRLLDISSASNVTITGITFLPPTSATNYTLSDGESAGIHLNNTVNCSVIDNIFTGSPAAFAVMVTGLSATDNLVSRNNLAGCGITYAYNGANRTICTENTITNSPSDGLSGVGNGSQDSQDCIVASNRIYSSARMGIEDWNTMRGTKILNNIIRTTGTNPANVTGGACFGISAVGRGTLVQGNTIIDSPTYGIEASGTGLRILNNHCRQVAGSLIGTAYGIFVNAGQTTGEMRGAVVRDNTIVDFQYGVMAWHETGAVVIEGNTIQDALTTAISCDTDDSQTLLTISANYIRYTRPLAGVTARTGIQTYSSSNSGAKAVVISRNMLEYETSAGTGSLGYEIAIRPATNNILIEGNVINGGGIAPNGQHPGISTQGATITGARVLNNTLLAGATLDTTGMTSVVTANNVTAS